LKIGKQTLLIEQPADLEHQLLELTGCSPAEIARGLEFPCLASAVASALIPFVKDPPHRQALAQAIAEAGVDRIRGEVRKLYKGIKSGDKK
jgi:hypothetical protein